MLLTHLVERYPKYEKWAAGCSDYKILDNSLIELGGAVELERVLYAARKVYADEIILPDVFLQGPETVRAVKNSLETLARMDALNKFKLMAVCQGRNEKEFRETFETLVAMPEIDVIGIPKVCAKLHPAGRPYFESLWTYEHKEIHLLGLWYSWEELSRYRDADRIRSMDTCMAAFQTRWNLPVSAVRPDKQTIDLEATELDHDKLLTKIGGVGNAYGRFYRS